jgi:hypothetical protein
MPSQVPFWFESIRAIPRRPARFTWSQIAGGDNFSPMNATGHAKRVGGVFLNVCIFALLVLSPARTGYEKYMSRIRFRLIPFVW